MAGEEDTIPISALQHWACCPRQCGLTHLEQAFAENMGWAVYPMAFELLPPLRPKSRAAAVVGDGDYAECVRQ